MSRRFFQSVPCCNGTDHEKRVDEAAAYLLGLVLFFNKGEKKDKILSKVQRLGFTQGETMEALMLLTSANIIEQQVHGCFNRKVGQVVTGYARESKLSHLFEELDKIKPSERNRELAQDIGVQVATQVLDHVI